MTTSHLGRLQKVDIRKVWQHEATSFTPWLAQAENIELLGDTLGLSLEVEAQEKFVGPFRADILCKDTADDSWVLIENQLDRTDHSHLGQLLTYAAGLETVTIVWIAGHFTDEHRAALDWLNSITDDSFSFFGLEVEVWRIGDSMAAPKFNVISKPNDWTRQVADGKKGVENSLTPTKQLQVEYWTAFREHLAESGSKLRATKPLAQNWMNLALGRSGIQLVAVASTWDNESNSYSGEIRAEVYFESRTKTLFPLFAAQREAVESALGAAMVWQDQPDQKSAKAYFRLSAKIDDRDDWSNQHAWLQAKLEAMHRILAPIVRDL